MYICISGICIFVNYKVPEYAYMYICIYIYIYVYKNSFIPKYMYIYTYIYKYTYMHIRGPCILHICIFLIYIYAYSPLPLDAQIPESWYPVAGQPLLHSLGHLVACNRGSQCGREVFIANRLLTCVFLNRVETFRNV